MIHCPLGGSTSITFFGLQNWTTARDWINFPSWSVSCELFFYFSLPFLLYLLRRMDPKTVKLLLPAAAIVATLVGVIGATYVAPHSAFEFTVRYLPLLRWPEFLTGVFLGYVYKRSRVPKYVEAHGDLLALAGGLLAAATILVFRKQPLFLHSGGLTIPYAIVIIGLAEATGPIYRLLSNPVAIMLGEASYSIYILQIPFKYLMADFWAMYAGDAARPVWFRAITFFGVIGFAVFVNKAFENPARKAILKLVQPAPTAPVPPRLESEFWVTTARSRIQSRTPSDMDCGRGWYCGNLPHQKFFQFSLAAANKPHRAAKFLKDGRNLARSIGNFGSFLDLGDFRPPFATAISAAATGNPVV